MYLMKPNEQRAKTAIFLIGIVLALEVISLLSDFLQYDLIQKMISGTTVSYSEATMNDSRQQIIGIVYFIAYIISGITFIMWFRRAYFNLHQKVGYLSRSEGMAAGAWFIPFLNWFVPYTIMRELYVESARLLRKDNESRSFQLNTSYIVIWWTLWIISSLISQFVFRFTMDAQSLDELKFSTEASMIGSFVGIPLAIITIKVVKDYSAIEHLLLSLKEEEEVAAII